MSTDLVWIVGGPGDREDLRYSIRSVETNLHLDYRDVWVVGDPPEWFRGARMPLEPHPEKFRNQRRSITAYVNHPDAADILILLNDDMFITEPVDTDLPICRYANRLTAWAEEHRKARAGHAWDCWQCHIIDTADWIAERTGTDPWLYEAHTPLLFDTARLREAVNAYPADRRFVVGELYPIAGAGGEGEHCGNAKCKTPESFAKKLANPMPYLSCSPETWRNPVGPYVRGMFPNPSRYEQQVRVEVAA